MSQLIRVSGQKNGLDVSSSVGYSFTVAQNDDNATYEAGLRQNYAISRNDQTEFDGTTSAGVVTYIVEQNSGNVPVLVPFSQNGKTYNFGKWIGTSGDNFTPTDNSTLTAFYKGHFLSNDINGLSSNSQRKLVRDTDGYYHTVYTSSNVLWKTKSTTTNFGGNWAAEETLLEDFETTNPSLDVTGTTLALVTEVTDGDDAVIYLWESNTGQYTNVALIDVDYYGSAYPVVSRTPNEIFIIYKSSATDPLKYRRKYKNTSQQWVWTNEATLPHSTSSSINPSIYGDENYDDVYIAWQEGNTQIKYLSLRRHQNDMTELDFETPSSGTGYTFNEFPSISLHNNQPIITWKGRRKESVEQKIASPDAFIYVNRTLIRVRVSGNWTATQVAGSDVNYSNVNSSSGSPRESVICWSENNGQRTKWLRRVNDSYSNFSNLSNTGALVNVSNGTSLSNIKAIVFDKSGSPYLVNRATTDFSAGMSKISADDEVTYGRTGIVYKDKLEFVFSVEDVILNDKKIDFVSMIDTLPILNIDELNSKTQTNTFSLNQDSQLFFSLYYIVINPKTADSVLSKDEYVNFKLQLVAANNNKVAGTFDDITYNISNVFDYDNLNYQVDCSGIQSGDYYLRLITESNIQGSLNIANVQNDAEQLTKKSYQNINFNGEGLPTVYALLQNFPNPFNPSTSIRFQLPESGNVTLKIYDILGREVITLVDEFKTEGRYEVKFNASSLASGVYLYRLMVNDFITVKKMLMIK